LFGFKIQNQKIAKKGLEVLKKHHGIAISSEAMTLGLDTRPPCRFERRLLNPYTQVVLDVAHNKDGISHLLQEVQKLIHREKISKIEIICGFSKDKDFKSCVKLINEFISQNQGVKFNVSTVKAKHYRALDSSILQNEFNSFQSSLLKASSFPDVFSGVSNVMNSVTLSEKDRNIKRTLVLAFGSLFIMHDVRVALNLIDPNLSKHSDLEEHIYLNE
jgi:folylpolyglutamate synthase/dihydropteroate synthase